MVKPLAAKSVIVLFMTVLEITVPVTKGFPVTKENVPLVYAVKPPTMVKS